MKNNTRNLVRDRRALSTVITTLIIVLLVLVAIGIVWLVVRGVIEDASGQIDVLSNCPRVDVRATAGNCGAGATNYECNVTLERRSGGEDFGGTKLVFGDGTNSGNVIDGPNMDVLQTTTLTDQDSGIAVSVVPADDAPTEVRVTVWFTDDNGEEQICSNTAIYEGVTFA